MENWRQFNLGNWAFIGFMVGIGAIYAGWELDLAWPEEAFVFGIMATGAFMGWFHTRWDSLHKLYLRDNPSPGIMRVAVFLSMGWITLTLLLFGSVRIQGIWYFYYWIIGLGCLYVFGVLGAQIIGLRLRVDAYERNNNAAGVFIGAFVLSTGLIYGGSVWGESNPESFQQPAPFFELLPSYEDGGWIIGLFFLLGWTILYFCMELWFARESSRGIKAIRRDRSLEDGKAAALYCLGCAIPLTTAVSGDYHGLYDSLLSFSAIALPVLAGEVLRPATSTEARDPQEPYIYLGIGIAAAIMSPLVSSIIGFR